MLLNSKNRKALRDLAQPVEIAELNRQLDWVWRQLLGGLPLKALEEEAQEVIMSKVGSEDLAQYSTIEQTDQSIKATVTNLNLAQYTTVAQTATQISLAVADKASKSELTQTATQLTSSIADKASKSELSQTASSLTSTINGVNSTLSSQIQQLGSGVAVKLKDTSVNASFEARISAGNTQTGATGYGLSFYYGSTYSGALLTNSVGGMDLSSPVKVTVQGSGVYIDGINYAMIGGGGKSVTIDNDGVSVAGNLRPIVSGDYSLGTRDALGNYRWKNVNITGSVDSSSDRRLKKNIAHLNASELLMKLTPRRYRMKADDQKLRFGFIAQEVAEVLADTDYEDAQLFSGDDPDHLSLCYTELIAVLVEGYQKQQAELAALKALILSKGGAILAGE